MGMYGDVAAEVKGLGTLVAIDCGANKKLCKKLKVSTESYTLKHYKDGEYHKDYDRQESVKSMTNFMKDPVGDAPWDEDPLAGDVRHLGNDNDLRKLLQKEKKPVLLMFYAPWCGHCKQLKPEFAEAATELKGEAILAGMDVDKPENYGSRQTFNITGFPTIYYFEGGKMKYLYGGERNKAGILTWMRDPQPPKEPEKELGWSDEDNNVVHLLDETFDEFIQEHNSVMVMFYAPWCGHCKKMKPEYSEAATQLIDEEVDGVLAAVDATVATEVAKRYEVKGYPTVKYFKDGEFAWDFNERLKDKIIEHMRDPQEPPPPPPPEPAWSEQETDVHHLTEETFKPFLKKKKHTLVMFYAPWCGHCKKAKPEFTSAAETFKDNNKVAYAAVDCTAETEICSTYDVSGYPTLKYFNYGKNPQAYMGGRTEQDFIAFMNDPTNPSPAPKEPQEDFFEEIDGGENVYQLTESSFDTFVKERSSVLVMFYAPWCGHCKKSKPDFAAAATQLDEEGIDAALAAVDATVEKGLQNRFDVTGFPKFKYFRNGAFAFDYSSKRDTQSFVEFMKDPKVTPAPPPEPKWSEIPNNIHHLTTDNFDTFVTIKEHVLVMFYAPWCGHCKAAKPAYSTTADNFKDDPTKYLAAVDCTENTEICTSQEVSGYPTFKLFSNGKFNKDFSGARSVTDFTDFMMQLKSSHKREEL
ncbi:protein disulfide-isomerase A5-like [Saccoglossus kowalevskii]|uniref:Protein disulfide-isomerase A5-like n=1 Tax=Saccoglossus kowalevskii TaxID=10224 RepID=A0ABM0GWS7_SACKO|nr:PREDICTED: protein disulfide-isomerase A5-like [Saccoglossus kowalevskii]